MRGLPARGTGISAIGTIVCLDGDVSDELVLELVDHSLAEVLKKLPKKLQAEYERLL